MSEDLNQDFETLDLVPGASPEEVRAAYLDLVKIWHPDRYQSEPERLRQRAERKLTEITLAYERLSRGAGARVSPDPVPMDFGERWGYINQTGHTVIHPEYLAARRFQEGLAAVRMVDKWGFIDATGTYRINPLYDECADFSEGLAAVLWYGRWGYVDKTGAFAVQPRFHEAGPFQQGVARVRLGARSGTVNRAGQVDFDPVAGGRIEGH